MHHNQYFISLTFYPNSKSSILLTQIFTDIHTRHLVLKRSTNILLHSGTREKEEWVPEEATAHAWHLKHNQRHPSSHRPIALFYGVTCTATQAGMKLEGVFFS